MKHLFNLLALLIFTGSVNAQLSDNFNDSIFTRKNWIGNDSLFVIQDGFLKLNTTVAGSASYVMKCDFSNDFEWNLTAYNLFSPSSSNFCRYYLYSNTINPDSSNVSYYIQIGGSVGNTDSISLYKQIGNSRVRLIAGRPSTVGKSQNKLQIRVHRDSNNIWSVESDTGLTGNFIQEGVYVDTSFWVNGYTGISCHYTSSNGKNFWFDQVYAGNYRYDSIPPKIDSILVLDSVTLKVVFNEAMHESTYRLDNFYLEELGKPIAISFNNGYVLIFKSPFKNKKSYAFTINNVEDKSGNLLINYITTVQYYLPQRFDVLITELMPDPSPPNDLPEAEFIELYNNTGITIKLNDWWITDGSTETLLPEISLQKGEVIILCAETNRSLFEPYGRTIGLSSIPTLNNSSDHLTLLWKGMIIHDVEYSTSSYQNIEKQNGGWSLEMKSRRALCRGIKNFAATTDSSGGTPGKFSETDKIQNTIKCIASEMKDSSHVVLVFDDVLDSISLIKSSISLDEGVILNRKVKGRDHDSLELMIENVALNKTTLISIDTLVNCLSERTSNIQTSFTRYYTVSATRNDVIFSEILCNPVNNLGGYPAEYIEIYNRTDNAINIMQWQLKDEVSTAFLPNCILLPHQFAVITSTSSVKYFTEGKVLGVTNFPSLGNEGDRLSLWDTVGNCIHYVAYNKSMFKNAKSTIDGCSLEIIDPDFPCVLNSNWTASTSIKRGTPGTKNSVQGNLKDVELPMVTDLYSIDSIHELVRFSESVFLSNDEFFKDQDFIDSLTLLPPEYNKLLLRVFDTKSALHIKGIQDCAGNNLQEMALEMLMPQPIVRGDIVINEVLFNPKNNGFDYIELYNRSDKVVDLKDIILSNTDKNDTLLSMMQPVSEGKLLKPGEFVLFTEDALALANIYSVKNPHAIYECEIPSMNSDKGHIILMQKSGLVLDELYYDEKMHFEMIKDVKGVSLEKIDYNRLSEERDNWTSASSICGFGTPGYMNSQASSGYVNDNLFSVSKHIISPDQDGKDDFITFGWSLPSENYFGEIFLLDMNGNKVTQLMQRESLGVKGEYTWKGETDNNQLPPEGLYIVYFRFQKNEGEMQEAYKSIGITYRK